MNTQRKAFTIIELLSVIAIVGLLVAIILPAVQMAREAARRAQCASNLKMIGLALQNYEASHRMFPSAQYANAQVPSTGTSGSNKFFSAHTHLLPYLDQAEVFNAINFQVQYNVDPDDVYYPKELQTVVQIIIETFLCPSDSRQLKFHANVNYRVNLGPGAYMWPSQDTTAGSAGAFTPFAWYSPRDFIDGTGNTVGFSEKLVGDDADATFSPERDFWYSNAAALGVLPPTDDMVTICHALTAPTPSHYSHGGYTWMMGAYENTFYNHSVTPNSTTPDCSAEAAKVPPHTNGGVYAARSQHSRGVNCLMMDGAVRFVSNSIDLQVWRGISTKAGAELISTAEF